MNYKKIGLILFVIGIFLLIAVKFVGFATQNTIPSSVSVTRPVTETPSGGGAVTGGGGGEISALRDFLIQPDLLKIIIKQGETKREIIRIKNTGDQLIKIDSVRGEAVDRFMAISDTSFVIEPGQYKDVVIDFFAKENEVPDAYTGSIIVKGNGITKIVNVIVEVKPRLPLFDVTTKLAKSEVIPGENIVGEITIINMGDLEGFDVKLHYAIRDFNGRELIFREESLAIEKELTVVRQLNVPSSTQPGTYVFYARASYGGAVAVGSESFIVEEIAFAPIVKSKVVWYILIIIILLIIILLLLRRRKKKDENKDTVARIRREKSPKIVYVGR